LDKIDKIILDELNRQSIKAALEEANKISDDAVIKAYQGFMSLANKRKKHSDYLNQFGIETLNNSVDATFLFELFNDEEKLTEVLRKHKLSIFL
jgi:chaperonin cofactor prefoldin